MKTVAAIWHVDLMADCPQCMQYVDLLAENEFWVGRENLMIAEHGTPRTTNMAVVCPECGCQFVVDCDW